MNQPINDEGATSVSYTVKELFEDIKDSLKNLDVKMSNKASRDELQELAGELQHEVNELNARLTSHHGRIDKLEARQEFEERTSSKISEWRKWLWPFLATILLIAISIVQLLKTK